MYVQEISTATAEVYNTPNYFLADRWQGRTIQARRDLSANPSPAHVLGREWTKNFIKDIIAFYNSPRIIFLFHTVSSVFLTKSK